MIHNKKVNKFKFLAIGLLVVFLFATACTEIQATQKIKIIFSVNSPADIPSILSQYNLKQSKLLYSNVYTASSLESDLLSLKSDSRITYAEFDEKISASQVTYTPPIATNDPFFTLDSLAEDKQWYLPKIRVPEAWNYTKGSSSVVVAIIDTGIHSSHLDLNDGRIGEGFDLIANKTIFSGTNSDDNGHGTAVAGVIGAIPNNQKGLAGINWNIRLMPVKALDREGNGDLSTISAGIMWAADHGANVINLSLGGSGFPNNITMANAISYAFNKNVLIVAAAGNDTAANGQNLDTNAVYPICADNGQNMILGVAASDVNDRKATFSNFGINCVDITAPGKKILTTAYLPSDPTSNNILIYASGTSLATPVVAGVAALIKANYPTLTNVQIRDLILKTADNIDALNPTDCLGTSCVGFLGKGRINALLALSPQPILNESLVREQSSGKVYLVSGGIKRYVSQFVLNQRYAGTPILDEISNQLTNYTLGTSVAPNTGTLIKGQTDSTVYYVDNGLRRPLTYLVFVSRKFSFAKVNVLSEPDVSAIALGDWYWPPDGTLVLIKGDPTVYVMDLQVARPTTFFVFTQRKLSFTKVITVTADEFSHVPRPLDRYWLAPLEGTLIKSSFSPSVYVIENGQKHELSGSAFSRLKYKFANIKTLPQAEVDVIMPGAPIL